MKQQIVGREEKWAVASGPVAVAWLALVVGTLLSATASAWNFDPSCSTTTRTEVQRARPAALFMLDRSGSMGSSTTYQCTIETCGYTGSVTATLWNIAKGAINQVVYDMTQPVPDEVIFGIGYFPRTIVEIEAREDAYTPIRNSLANTGPSGGTPTNEGIDALRTSRTLNTTGQSGAGVLITDGYPNSESQALTSACRMRADGKTLYVMGLGGRTDTPFNNKMAAAAGLGCCGGQANPTCSNGIGVDPCQNANVSKNTCHGSYQVYNQTEFRNALMKISTEIACTYPLDFSKFQEAKAPEDPRAVIVRMFGAAGTVYIEHTSRSADGEGWYFPSDSRDRVALSSRYCGEVQSGRVTHVETQLACDCSVPRGAECLVPNPPEGVCFKGNWICDDGYDWCEPMAPAVCPDPCLGVPRGRACHVDNTTNYTQFDEGPNDVRSEKNRCKIGAIFCNERVSECRPRFTAMPELCDGLDNDCDRQVDNISVSWDKSAFDNLSIARQSPKAGAACYERNSCVCPSGFGQHAGTGSTQAEEFQAYLNAWTPVCQCRDALEY